MIVAALFSFLLANKMLWRPLSVRWMKKETYLRQKCVQFQNMCFHNRTIDGAQMDASFSTMKYFMFQLSLHSTHTYCTPYLLSSSVSWQTPKRRHWRSSIDDNYDGFGGTIVQAKLPLASETILPNENTLDGDHKTENFTAAAGWVYR